MNLPKQPTRIIHPSIQDIYIKPNTSIDHQDKNILVIKTFNNEEGIMNLLADLKDIQAQAEEQIGHIDRVDLTVH